MNQETFDHVKGAGDVAAVAVTIGTIASYLPSIAALFTIIWTGLRIWESETVKSLTGRA